MITMLFDKVLFQIIPAEPDNTLIHLPNPPRESFSRAKVIAVGPGRAEDPMILKPGDTVYVHEYVVDKTIKLDGTYYFIADQWDVLAKDTACV